MKKPRCKCKHGRKRCVLKKHDGHAVPHRVKATKKERARGVGRFYFWNTGRIWPLKRMKLVKVERTERGFEVEMVKE